MRGQARDPGLLRNEVGRQDRFGGHGRHVFSLGCCVCKIIIQPMDVYAIYLRGMGKNECELALTTTAKEASRPLEVSRLPLVGCANPGREIDRRKRSILSEVGGRMVCESVQVE